MIDPVALERHRTFGRDMAEQHYKQFPAAIFTPAMVLPIMRECMADTAADHGVGTAALEPLARSAAAGFIRQWRQLQRNGKQQ